jgi:hypothetical protein
MTVTRRKWNWTQFQLDKLNKVEEVLTQYDQYKPLTLRQIFYQLVGRELIANTRSQYNMLSQLLKYGRLDGYIPWEDIEDRVRAVHSGTGWLNKEHFIGQTKRNLLRGYRRHLVQDQPVFFEVWVEKDALSGIFSRVTSQYCIDTVVCRGYSSVTFLNDYKERVLEHELGGQKPIMLYFGDFDPSGEDMFYAMRTTLEEEMDLPNVTFRKVALTREDITTYRLPHNPDAIKRSDTRAAGHVMRHGEVAVELDALPPDVLTEKIKAAIEGELNIQAFEEQAARERDDLVELDCLRQQIVGMLD